MFYFQINALSHTIKIIVLPSFLRPKLKLLSKCCVLKSASILYLIYIFPYFITLYIKIGSFYIFLKITYVVGSH